MNCPKKYTMGVVSIDFVVIQIPNANQRPKQYLHDSSLYRKDFGYFHNNQSEYESPSLELYRWILVHDLNSLIGRDEM